MLVVDSFAGYYAGRIGSVWIGLMEIWSSKMESVLGRIVSVATNGATRIRENMQNLVIIRYYNNIDSINR